MGYILNAEALRSLTEIRQEYEDKKQVQLHKKTSKLGLPTLFGGTDIEKRAKQINFIEKMVLVMNKHLQVGHTYLIASRMLLAVCLYVQGQITDNCTLLSGRKALLHQLINKKLGITDNNFLDAEDKAVCFDAAHALTSIPSALEEVNEELKSLGMQSISFSDWSDFRTAIAKECITLKRPNNNYPFTSIMKPAFGMAFSYVGASVGFLVGDVINKSTQLLPARYYVSAGISSIALTLHTSNALGLSLLVPIIANRLLESFFQISLGHVGAITFNILGQGVGTGVGLTLDLAYYLSFVTYSTLKELYNNELDNQNLTGLRIADGVLVINGIPVDIQECHVESPLESGVQNIRIEKDGNIFINDILASKIVEDGLIKADMSDNTLSVLPAL